VYTKQAETAAAGGAGGAATTDPIQMFVDNHENNSLAIAVLKGDKKVSLCKLEEYVETLTTHVQLFEHHHFVMRLN